MFALASLHAVRAHLAPTAWISKAFALALAGCTAVSADSLNVSPPAKTGAASNAVNAQQAQGGKAAGPRAAVGKRSTHYDLSRHLAHAEIRRGEELVIDFGGAGEAKYTLGGWNTHMRPGVTIEGTTAALVTGSYGDITTPVPFDDGATITLRVRAPRDGDLTFYVDGALVQRVKTDKAAFQVVRLELPAEKLGKGEHMLRVRGSGMAKLGSHESAVAIDWMTIARKGATTNEVPNVSAVDRALVLPTGVSLGYALKVPDAARLSASVQGERTAKLNVRAVRDDGSTLALGVAQAGARLDIDLGTLAGQVARIELTAEAGALQLTEVRVTVPQQQVINPRKMRNVLVYLIDTLRADHLKAFNRDTRVRTPGLDALVASGAAVFTSAHTQENWTKPSVATLLSSLFPWEHNATTTEGVVPSSVQMLPEVLGARGYYTGAFIANGYVSDKFGFKQGWDFYRNYIREGRYSRAEFLAADVLEWLDKRPEKPFFLYVHAIDPHVPYKPTGEFLSLYDPEPYKGVVNFKGDNELLEKIKIGKIRLNPRDKVHLEALYDSEISYHDLHFRSILQSLEKRNLSDDTMVVVVADHGEEFWDHGSVGHGHSVYEELLRIPMVVHVPGLLKGPTSIATSAGLVDVMPTVLEALGESLPEGLSGRSLMSDLLGKEQDAPRIVVSGFMDGWRTAVIDRLKLIQRTERRVMVHDLAHDPGEQTDVMSSRPVTTRYLRGQLGLALANSQPAAVSGKKPHRGQTTTIDAETEAQLRALGYVGTSRR
jgi:arylsulfatase A-like enzyme